MAPSIFNTLLLTQRFSKSLLNQLNKTQRHGVQWKLVYLSSYYYHTSPTYLGRRAEEAKQRAREAQQKSKLMDRPVVSVWKNMTVKELSTAVNRPVRDVLEAISYSDPSRYTQDSVIEDRHVMYDAVRRLGAKCKQVPPPSATVDKPDETDAVKRPPANPSQLVKRHPVVTVMGHVDHGKTTLLDSLRHTSVAQSEYGGITQHIGAFNVTLDTGERITFLDTPGHAAFSAMRARGASVTDLVILVVAADDGVMEQTVQSIEMAKDANVAMVVAINKIDKADADIERTQKMLAEQGIQVEPLGGDVPCVNISALKSTNLKELMETVVALAEILDLKGDPKGLVEGAVIEVSTEVGRGKLATVLIQRGTLRKGAILVSGVAWAKVRAMFDHAGSPVSEAKLSEAVQVIGWRELPAAGDEILEVEDERRAHAVIRVRQAKQHKAKAESDFEVIQLKREEYNKEYKEKLRERRALGIRFGRNDYGVRKKEIQEGDGLPRVNVIIKSDVLGSAEAILDTFEAYGDERRCHLDVVHYGIGSVTESDVELAQTFDAIIYTFHIDTPRKIQDFAEKSSVPIRSHRVIYKLIDDIKNEICKKLPPELEEEVIGKANVLQQFEINEKKKKSIIAGCRCTEGLLKKNEMFRVMRQGEKIYEGKLSSMRHLKDEVNSIKSGIECGLKFAEDVSVQPGDTIICYTIHKKPPTVRWDPGF